jgi:TRAP transporter TAXI family solute receptor
MTPFNRREAATLIGGAIGASACSVLAYAQEPRLAFMTAGQGSAFLPYGQGIAKVLAAAGINQVDVIESSGSNENLNSVDASPRVIGMAFLGSALDALNGTGFAAGKRHQNVRALFPMYETAFMTAALASRRITSMTALNGMRVGCGPLHGPAEDYFRAMIEVTGITATIASGTPSEQAKQLLNGEIDAFWQGGSVPIPSLASAANAADCDVFGLSPVEIAALSKRFAFMTKAAYPAGTYRGQTSQIDTVAAWNVVIAHKDLDEGVAYRITKSVLSEPNLAATVGAAARSTLAANAGKNTVVPYHVGARRALAELGATVP